MPVTVLSVWSRWSYLNKLVGLLSIEAIGQTQCIWGSFFVEFSEELVEGNMDITLNFVKVQGL